MSMIPILLAVALAVPPSQHEGATNREEPLPHAQDQAERHRLLRDPSPGVRLHAALALAQDNDTVAVSILIALLGDLTDARERKLLEDFLIDLAGTLGPKIDFGIDETTRRKARDAWTAWWQGTEKMDLLAELKKRTPKDKATSASILPTLARLIALRKPLGAAEAILACLPLVDDEAAFDALQDALHAVAYVRDKPQPVLLQSLADPIGIKRAAAAQALCAESYPQQAEIVRRLLKDPEPSVRLKAALALAKARDKAGVPALISLVASLPANQSFKAEDYLNDVAGGSRPKDMPLGEDEETRKKRSAAWSTWWEANKDKVDLATPFSPAMCDQIRAPKRRSVLGYTLHVQDTGTLTELGPDNKPRWTIKGLPGGCWDAQMLSGQRVLLVEGNAQVTERNQQGTILWKKRIPYPYAVQRLRNGNTFIACRDQLVEVDRTGKEVLKIVGEKRWSEATRKLANGEIVAYTFKNQLLHLDWTGRELKRFPIRGVDEEVFEQGCNDILDNGHVLISSPRQNTLIEFDGTGKEVHRFKMPAIQNGFRLANGHTLVATRKGKYVELDEKWQPIQEIVLKLPPAYRVKQR